MLDRDSACCSALGIIAHEAAACRLIRTNLPRRAYCPAEAGLLSCCCLPEGGVENHEVHVADYHGDDHDREADLYVCACVFERVYV